MSKRMAHSPRRFLPMVLVLALLALMSDLASAQTRAVTTSVIEWAKLTASDGATGDRFGHSVASSGDTVIVGAIGDTDYAGSAYVFQRNAGGPGNWGQVAKLTASDGAAGDLFGYSVASSGDTVIVGAPVSNSAYLFERDAGGAGNWGQVAKLTTSDGTEVDEFGWSVSMSGDTVVVGACEADDNGDDSGSAYLFERDEGGPGNWGQVAKLTASDGAAGDRFGMSVSISGDTVVVGARLDDDNGDDSGSAYLFERDEGGPGNWGQVAKLTASDGAEGDIFGNSVSISGETVVIGAHADDDNGKDSGSAYLFERDEGGPGNWGQVVKLTASDGSFWAIFGVSVSISGETAVVGARTLSNGSAYLFERDAGGAGNWGEVAKLTASDGALNDDFGTAVSIGGNTIVIGAYADDDNGEDSGSAYVFYRFEPVSWIYLPVVLRGY